MKKIPQQQTLMGDKCVVCGRTTPGKLGSDRGRRAVYRNSKGTLVRDNVFRRPRSGKDWKFFGWCHIGCWDGPLR
jgi:hypothetical protein